MEIQIGRGDGMGNRTANLQIKSLTSEKMSDILTTPPQTLKFWLFHWVTASGCITENGGSGEYAYRKRFWIALFQNTLSTIKKKGL